MKYGRWARPKLPAKRKSQSPPASPVPAWCIRILGDVALRKVDRLQLDADGVFINLLLALWPLQRDGRRACLLPMWA
jgi:hypothetical protein